MTPSLRIFNDDASNPGVVVRTITLQNPTKKNALTPSMLAELQQALRQPNDDGVRAIVLCGAGDTFSSGFDLSALDDDERARGVDPITAAADAIEASDVPVVVAVDGSCYGGAVEVCCAAAVRVASTSARFCVPAVKLGLVYPAGGLARLRRTLGRNSERVLLTGLPFSADDARAWGLIHDVVDDARSHARAIARAIADAAPIAVRGTVRALRAIDRDDAASVEEARAAALNSEDLVEGVVAAREKRPPKFQGR